MEIFDYLDKIGTNDLIDEVKRRLDGKQPLEFIGTTAEWDNLSAAEKQQYSVANFTDDGYGTYGYGVDTTSNSFPVYWRKMEGVLECWGVIPANTSAVVFPFEYDSLPSISMESYDPYLGTLHAIVVNPTTTGFKPNDGQSGTASLTLRTSASFRVIGIKEG